MSMTQRERDRRADLIELASRDAVDVEGAASALLGAAITIMAAERGEAGAVIAIEALFEGIGRRLRQ